MCISKQRYEEHGAGMIHKKAPLLAESIEACAVFSSLPSHLWSVDLRVDLLWALRPRAGKNTLVKCLHMNTYLKAHSLSLCSAGPSDRHHNAVETSFITAAAGDLHVKTYLKAHSSISHCIGLSVRDHNARDFVTAAAGD